MTTSKTRHGGKGTKRRGHKRMRGGMNAVGAAPWQLRNLGPPNQQYNNVFVKGGPFGAAVQNVSGTQPSVVEGVFPSAANLKLIQSAGSRHRRGGVNTTSSSSSSGGKRRTKRGGYWGKVLSQALVPFSLWFAQNKYGTRKNRGKK